MKSSYKKFQGKSLDGKDIGKGINGGFRHLKELALASQVSYTLKLEEELGTCHTSDFSLPFSALCINFLIPY